MKKRYSWWIVPLILSALTGKAQVINIEGKRFIKDSNGFVGKADFVWSLNQNVKQVLILNANVHVQYKHNQHRLLVITDLSFIKADQQNFVNAGYQHVRYSCKLAKLLTWESFVQAQYNLALLLNRRYLAGTGPRLRVLKKQHVKLYAASLYMYEYQSQYYDSIQRYNNRLSSYLTCNIDFPRADLSATVFYQPNLADFNDYRIATDASLEFEISRHFNFKAGFNMLYDTWQPPGIPALSYFIRNGISLKF